MAKQLKNFFFFPFCNSIQVRSTGFVSPSRFTMDVSEETSQTAVTGLDAFTFEYVVRWPVSLVLSKKALKRYQLLFRHLFHTKHVERQLCTTWVEHQSARMFHLQPGTSYAMAFALRQRMLNFVQSFQYYMMFEVIEPQWHVMIQKVEQVRLATDPEK